MSPSNNATAPSGGNSAAAALPTAAVAGIAAGASVVVIGAIAFVLFSSGSLGSLFRRTPVGEFSTPWSGGSAGEHTRLVG